MNNKIKTSKNLVLLHGWGMHNGMWGNFATQLSRDYNVTLVHLPVYDSFKKISTEIVTQLDNAPFYIVGWSLGGAIALDIAERYSERVKGLILIATNPHFIETPDWSGMQIKTFNAFAKRLNNNSTTTLQYFLSLQIPLGSSKLLKEVKRRFASESMLELNELEITLSLLRYDLRLTLTKLNCPIISILSDDDRLVPVAIGESMQKLNSNLQLITLQNAGHIPFITQPENCLNAIHTFLDKSG